MTRLITIAVTMLTTIQSYAQGAPAEAKVVSAALAGTACPAQQKAAARLSDDFSRLEIEVPAMSASIEANGKRLARVNCDIIVTIEHTAGYQLAPESYTAKVSGKIGDGVDGKLGYRYHYQGEPTTPVAELDYTQPGAVTPTDVDLSPTKSFSACGKSATIVQSVSLRLMVKGAGEPSELKLDAGGKTKLAWRACKS